MASRSATNTYFATSIRNLHQGRDIGRARGKDLAGDSWSRRDIGALTTAMISFHSRLTRPASILVCSHEP
jgi:hypothetical protein